MPDSHTSRLPHVVHGTSYKYVKSEDILYIHPYQDASFAVFMVCDGHAGSEAASYVAAHFNRIIASIVPKQLPNFDNEQDVLEYAEQIRQAVTQTYVKLDNEWSRLGQDAGTTATVAIVTGWLLTVANAGDSLAVLDTPNGLIDMCQSHRIESNEFEQERLKAAGVQLAPLGFHLQGPAKPNEVGVGPLRLWPGGLCVARSIGDLDAGPQIVPAPHIRQVVVPPTGARLVMATDGLWDVMTPAKAARSIRSKLPPAAAHNLIDTASRDRRFADDMSVIVVDMLPNDKVTYPSLTSHHNTGAADLAVKKGCWSCFGAPSTVETPADPTTHPTLKLLADVDALLQYPLLQQMLARVSVRVVKPSHGRGDYTMHGSEAHVFKGTVTGAGWKLAGASDDDTKEASEGAKNGSDVLNGRGGSENGRVPVVLEH